jgi:hypothetical protein
MTDRELLELAAKAAGIRLEWDGHPDQWVPMYYSGKTYHSWNPLEDDGEAFRLAVKMKMWISIAGSSCAVERPANVIELTSGSEQKHGDPYLYARRAIVRAAAEIGKQQT